MKFGISSVYRELRLKYWKEKLDDPAFRGEFLQERLFGNLPVPGWAIENPPPDGQLLRILDINSGPIPAIGNHHQKIPVEVVATDDLADEYLKLWEAYGIVPLVRPISSCPEDILTTFGPRSFDIIYCYNGLHYTKDPVPVYRQLLQCLRPNGKIITFHDLPDTERQCNRERARYFHWVKGEKVMIRITNSLRNLEDALPEANLAWRMENTLVCLELSKRRTLRPPRIVEPLGEADEDTTELPLLHSMHLPKTGGSSFRVYLKTLYGDSLQLLYSFEETAPKMVGSFKLNQNTRCVHGHFQANAYEKHLPGALKITWIRDPVERIVSSYYQYLRSPESERNSDFCRRFFNEGWNLMDFARSQEMRDHILWCFNGVPLDDFFFIGVTERFNESLRLFCRLINKPVPEDCLQTNINPGKAVEKRYFIPDNHRRELEALYAEELNLYQYVNYRLDQQIKAVTEGFRQVPAVQSRSLA